jgi:predicted MFS family arabinose efflux permease
MNTGGRWERRFEGLQPLIRSLRTGTGKSALILPASLLFYIGLGLASFAMIFYARDVFRAPTSLIGWLAALPQLCYFSGCFLFQPLLGVLLPRHYLVIATACAAALLGGILLAPSLALVFVLYGLFGLSFSLFWPPLMGWMAFGKEDRALNRDLGRFNLTWNTGNIISPYWAGVLLEREISLPFKVAALAMAATCLFVLAGSAALPRVRRDREREPRKKKEAGSEDRSTPLRFPSWIGLFASYVVLGVLISIFPLFLRDKLVIPENRIGLLLLLRALLTTFGFFLLGRLAFWHFKPWPMLLGQGLTALLLAVMTRLQTAPALALALAVFGLLFSLSYNESLFHGVAGSRRRSARMAVHEGLLTAGMVCGASGGGLLYQFANFRIVLLFCCLLVAAAFLAQTVLVLSLRGRQVR